MIREDICKLQQYRPVKTESSDLNLVLVSLKAFVVLLPRPTIVERVLRLWHTCRVVFQPIDPEDIAVVAVGSSKEVVFHGGPQPWVLDSSKFSQTRE